MDYGRLVAVLIEAVKEQQEQIAEHKSTIQLLLKEMQETKARLAVC